MRWRAIAAAPRAPGASVGDSSSTVASPRAASTSGEAARSRAMLDWMDSRRAGPAAATPPPMTIALDAEGQDERSDRPGQVVGHSVGDLDRDLIAG